VFANFSHGFLGMSCFFYCFAFSPVGALALRRSPRRQRQARENAKNTTNAKKKTKKTQDIPRKPCEKIQHLRKTAVLAI